MKLHYFSIILVLGGLFGLPAAALADTSEAVTNFAQDAVLSRAGDLKISEKISYDFASTAPHDLSYSIPLTYHDDQGREFRMAFNLTGISLNGQTETISPYVTTSSVRLTLPAGKSATSKREYEVDYTLSPVVLRGLDADIFKLNVTGLGWAVPINQATLKLDAPAAPSDDLTCYVGSQGSTSGRCSVTQSGSVATVTSYAPLQPGEGLSIYANFPPKSFAGYLQPYEQHPSSPLRKILELVGLIVLVALAAVGLATWRRRRYTNANEAPKDQANRE